MKCSKCGFENPYDTRFCGNCGASFRAQDDFPSNHTKTVQTPMKERSRGTVLAGRYEIVEELGRGGMGNVYRVVDKKLNEEIALKILHPVIAADEKTIERFKNELKFARKIVHKNVCQMYDLSEEEGTPYITMEYVPGEDLKGMIRMMGQLSLGRALSIAKQVCQGLEEAHNLGIVHRDLKPRNIMIDKRGNARIMDFGIARSIRASGITGDGIMVGTPEYMSPEQVKGEKVDQRSDIYAMGVILFEMVTGKVPFEGDTSLSIALKHKTELPPNPQEYNALIPEELSQVILKCMEKEKEKRYQSAKELLLELSKIEREISIEERIPTRRKTRAITPKKQLSSLLLPGILIAGILIILGYIFISRILPPRGMKWKNSIAVLPVEDLSLERNQDAFCEGMTDALITNLHLLIPELKVISKRSVMKYKNSDKDFTDIGKELQVATVLEMSLQIDNNTIRVTANLRSTEDGSTLWSDIYEDKLESIFTIQDKISAAIAEPLKVHFVTEKTSSVRTREPANFAAYEYYVKGKYLIEIKYYTDEKEEDFQKGLKMYTKALESDPDYALAYYGLGNAYEARYINEKDEMFLELMKEYYYKAYEIDDNLAEANIGLGWVYFYQVNNDRAYDFFARAFELDPYNADINWNVGAFLRSIGLYRKAVKYYSRAIELEPLFIDFYKSQILCYMFSGEFEKAENPLKKALEIEPDDFGLHLYYSRLLIMMAEYDEAARELDKAEKISPDMPVIQYQRAWILAVKGEKDKALRFIRGRAPHYYEVTCIYSLLRMKEEAIKYIKEGIELGLKEIGEYMYTYLLLISNPCFDSLRDDLRFKEIVKQQKKKYEEMLEKYDKL